MQKNKMLLANQKDFRNKICRKQKFSVKTIKESLKLTHLISVEPALVTLEPSSKLIKYISPPLIKKQLRNPLIQDHVPPFVFFLSSSQPPATYLQIPVGAQAFAQSWNRGRDSEPPVLTAERGFHRKFAKKWI